MPDTQPITTSFPWLTKKYIPVLDDKILGQTATFYLDELGDFLTDESDNNLVTEAGGGLIVIGDVYRYI